MRRRDFALTSEPLYRTATLERASIDTEQRTAEFSFSSETPVERLFGMEILDHDPASVRLGRLSDGGPVLLDHDPTQQVGVVESVRIASGKGRVVARFSRSTRGGEIFDDIADGIRRNVSVGYRVHDATTEQRDSKEGAVVRVTDWEPFEVSIVSIPADTSVGQGRSADTQQETSPMDDRDDIIEETTESRALEVADDVDIQEIENAAQKRERERANEIQDIAGKFKHVKTVQVAARSAVASGCSAQEFHKRALDLVAAASQSMPTKLDLTGKEVERYSLLRALNAQFEAHRSGTPMEKTAPYEYRLHLEQMDRLPAKRADQVRGMLVPWDVQANGNWGTRVAPADTVENVHLVPTDHLADQFIVGIRQTAAVMQAGATSLTGLVGDVSIPREESIAVEWLTEDEETTDQDYSTSSVTLSPTTVGASVPITRRLLKQSSPDVDALVRNNIVLGVGQEIDKQALQGSGVAPIPTGIRNQAGVLTQLIVTGALTWAQAVGFESTVEGATNLQAGASYIMHPTMKGIAKTTSKDAGSGQFIWSGNMVNDYPSFSSTHAGATADGIVFGNFAHLLVGFWGVVDVMMDPYAKATSGGLVVRVFQDVDMAVRRDDAFCIETLI